MTQSITQLTLGFLGQQPLVIDFDAPDVSSDGGAILLRQVDGRPSPTSPFSVGDLEVVWLARTIHCANSRILQAGWKSNIRPAILPKARQRSLANVPVSG
jgi:hypothetical protein